ncbi:MAG: 1-acyl-sn-glycerol-3-phosphate acyltransferase [Clostridia bacterium]|nr:1-acyl-sn-glycerol-3-phosphate acyltransferase [Clostridia bacterium]
MSEEKKTAPAQEVPTGPKRSFLYTLARVLAFIVFHTICPVKYHHRDRAGKKAPYILISNHFSNWDPLVNGYPVSQDITYLGKKELTGNRFMQWVFRQLHMIPIDRHNTDMAAVRNCMKALKNGEILGIYPEGTRHHQGIMEETEDGVALIALRGNVPILPMLIESKVRPFHVTHVYIGEDIETGDLRAQGINKETCTALMERIRERFQVMQRQLAEERRA